MHIVTNQNVAYEQTSCWPSWLKVVQHQKLTVIDHTKLCHRLLRLTVITSKGLVIYSRWCSVSITNDPNMCEALCPTSLWENDAYMTHFTCRKPGLDCTRLHPVRQHLGMLSEKLFLQYGPLTAMSPSKMYTNSFRPASPSGSDQYGSDKPGHLPGAAGHEEGLWHITIWALITCHMLLTPMHALIYVCALSGRSIIVHVYWGLKADTETNLKVRLK